MGQIFTHMYVDLDAVCSVWAVIKFIPGFERVYTTFVPADWDGEGMSLEDIAVDVEAGGKGIKGKALETGITSSAFKVLIKKYAPEEAKKILRHTVHFVEVQDTTGNVTKSILPDISRERRKTLSVNSLAGILKDMKLAGKSDRYIVSRFSEILDCRLAAGYAYLEAKEDADNATFFNDSMIALAEEPRHRDTTSILFRRGAKAVIYINGFNIGMLRNNSNKFPLNSPEIMKVIEEAGETGEWYYNIGGYIHCRGSLKAPAETRSRVKILDLAEAIHKTIIADKNLS